MQLIPRSQPRFKGTKTQQERQERIFRLCEAWASGAEGKRRWFKGQMRQETKQFQTTVWNELKSKYGYAKPEDDKPTIDPVENWEWIAQDAELPITKFGSASRISPHFESRGNRENSDTTVEINGDSLNRIKEDNARTKIQWNDDEISLLATELHALRRKEPGTQLVRMLNRAQKRLPRDRRRDITTVSQFEPVLRKLMEIDQQVWQDHEHIKNNREAIKEQQPAPSRDEILNSITDDEVTKLFGKRAISLMSPDEIISLIGTESLLEMVPLPALSAFVAKKQMETFNRFSDIESLMWDLYARLDGEEDHKPISPQAKERDNKLSKTPKVVFYGLLPRQYSEVTSRLGKRVVYHFVDKKRESDPVPKSADIVVFWARFASHSLQTKVKSSLPPGCQFVLHHGGISEMASIINDALRKYELACSI